MIRISGHFENLHAGEMAEQVALDAFIGLAVEMDGGEFGVDLELLDGGNEQISFSKMQIYEQQGKKDKAFAELKALIDKHPNDLNYQVMFGNWLLQNDKADEAVKIYRHVLKEEPDNTLAQMSMLDYYRAKDMTAEADILLMQLLKGKKTPESEKQALMRQYVMTSVKANVDSTRILAVFDEVLQTAPTSSMLIMKAAYMDLAQMEKDTINTVLLQALALEPDNVSARLQLIQNIWGKQDYPRVIALSQTGQEYNPDEMLFYYFEGFAHFLQDDHEQALEVFRKGTAQINDESNPEIVSDFYAMMGDILHEKGQSEEAFAAYDSCLQWKPDNIGALNNYAYYLSLQNRDLKRAEQMSLKTIQAPLQFCFQTKMMNCLRKLKSLSETKLSESLQTKVTMRDSLSVSKS
jgi:tetratricopeptide (TPR) repeat protein